MSDINIHGVPNAPVGYSLTGKKIMVHDPIAPLATSTKMYDATSFASSNQFTKLMFKEADGDMTAGQTDFTHASLIGATELLEITVNKVVEYVDEDFTFDPVTGTIDRTPNIWFAGDKMVVGFKSA